jgi:hypothetical protein
MIRGKLSGTVPAAADAPAAAAAGDDPAPAKGKGKGKGKGKAAEDATPTAAPIAPRDDLFIEPAKSGRATCRCVPGEGFRLYPAAYSCNRHPGHCKATIDQNTLRVGVEMENVDSSIPPRVMRWFHPECFVTASKSDGIDNVNFYDLAPEMFQGFAAVCSSLPVSPVCLTTHCPDHS